MNNKCANGRSVCNALLLFVRDLCLRLGVVLLTGDFNKGAERELSPLEAAFDHAGAEPQGHKWPECCGLVKKPHSQDRRLIMRHGSFDVVLASIGLKTTDKTWHFE